MGVLRLLGPDQSTVLWDFDDSTGAANPNTVITNLGDQLDLGISEVTSRLAARGEFGHDLLGYDMSPVAVTIPFTASATTDVNLFTGLGQLGRYLLSVSKDHPLYLEWTELVSNTRYMDVIGVLELPVLLRGQTGAGLIAGRAKSLGMIPLRLMRQPWMRGAAVTTSSDTVEDDPATGTPDGSRVYALTVTGDLPTPGKIRAQMDAGSTVASLLIGHRARKQRASTYFSDYLSDTGWFQCEATNRNWTITLGTDTTATTDGALASPATGNVVAQVNGAGSSAGVMTRRVRATRTTAMDSLRGSWVPTLRMRTTGSPFAWEVQIRWGPSTADPVAFAEATYTFEGDVGGVYVEPMMGRIDIPQTVALSGLAVEVWARELDGSAGNLNLDLVDLWPAEGLARVVVPPAAPTTTTGDLLTSPPDQITGDPVWVLADLTQGPLALLDSDLDAVGLGPNTGTVYAAGRHRFTFDYEIIEFGGGSVNTAELRVINVTDNTEMDSLAIGSDVPGHYTAVLELDADGADAYQAQATLTDMTGPGGRVAVYDITHQFVPSVLVNESIRTDPVRYAVDRLDSSGNLSGYLSIEGEVPALLEPGDNHLKLRADEIPFVGYTEYENDLTRDLTVTVTYDPRYAL